MKKKLFKIDIQLFADKEPETEAEVEEQEEFDPIEEVKKLKENSVSKEKYDELEKKNKELFKALIDGEQVNVVDDSKGSVDLNEKIKNLQKELFSEDSQFTNLEGWTKTLELRDAIIERDGEEADIFLPKSHSIIITENDKATAKKVAEEVKKAIDNCDGSDIVFTSLLANKIVEDARPQKKFKK